MKNFSISADKLAISFSALCAIHCLVLPLLIIFLPSIASLGLNQEAFHGWMVAAVIPTSLYALTIGCTKHDNFSVASYGSIGLLILLAAFLFGEHVLGELGEKGLTLIGTIIIALAHLKNYQLCRQQKDDCCPNE